MKPTRLFRGLVRGHRWVGLASSVLILWLVITGVLIHHAADLGLETEPVRSVWILDRYRIEEPEVASFKAGERWLSQAGKSLYLDGQRIGSLSEALVGAVGLPGSLVVATRDRLLILDPRGQPIEDLRAEHGLPVKIRHIGVRGGRIVLETRAGTFEADPDEMQWRAVRAILPRPAPVEAPATLRAAIAQDARSREISIERLLRDLHSGSFFGAAGRWAIDLVAFALIVMSLSGVWIWLRARREFSPARTAKPGDAARVHGKFSR